MFQNDNIDFPNICSIISFHFSKLKKKERERKGKKERQVEKREGS